MANYKLLELRFEHPSNARLNLFTRELWTGLVIKCADHQGRFLDNPALIMAAIFPYEFGKITFEMIEQALMELEAQNWIMRYEAAGMHLIQILQWWEGNSIAYSNPSLYPAMLGWTDRIRHNVKGKLFSENWNGHKEESPIIGQPFKPTSLPTSLPTVEMNPTPTPTPTPNRRRRHLKSDKDKNAAADADLVEKIFLAAGVSITHRDELKGRNDIFPKDCWAMLAWAFSQENIRKPGTIMAIDLLDGQRAPANWYNESAWTIIPLEIRQAGGLTITVISSDTDQRNAGNIARPSDAGLNSGSVIQGEDKQENQQSLVAIRISKPDETITPQVEQWWQSVQGQLKMEMPKAAFDQWVQDTAPLHFSDGILQIMAKTRISRQWLEERLSSTAIRLLSGIANQNISIEFVTREETSL